MSKMLWNKTLLPQKTDPVVDYVCSLYEPELRVPKTQPIPLKEMELADLPDRKAYRSMSRAAVMLANVCLPAQSILEPYVKENRFRVGLYCAVENGPNDFPACKEMKSTPAEEFAELYKKLRSPKVYLRQLPNLAPAQIGIFMNIMGPMNVYTHATAASIQALEQAEIDLREKVVDAALVCTAFSLEDPLLNLRTRKLFPEPAILREGAAAFVLVNDGTLTDWQQEASVANDGCAYGISQQLIQIAQRRLS